MKAGILSRRTRWALWIGRVTISGALVFLPAAGAFLVWLWLDDEGG